MDPSDNTDRTLVGWAEALRAFGLSDVAGKFDSDFRRDFRYLRQIDLPCYKAVLLPVSEFLERFDELHLLFSVEKMYCQLFPKTKEGRKYSMVDFSDFTSIREFISQSLGEKECGYEILCSEFETNQYGGTILSDDNAIVAEICEGLQTGVAYGNADVQLCLLAASDARLKYSPSAKGSEELLARAVNAIRRTVVQLERDLEAGRALSYQSGEFYLKGYFEFAYTRNTPGSGLRIVFFDAKTNANYYQLSSDLLRSVSKLVS